MEPINTRNLTMEQRAAVMGGRTPFIEQGPELPKPRDPSGAQMAKLWGRDRQTPSPANVAPRGPQPFPKMMYHPDPAAQIASNRPIMQVAENEQECEEAKANGWLDAPPIATREMLQHDGGKSGKRASTSGSPDAVIESSEPAPKWGAAAFASTTKVTDHHVKFLNANGYEVKSVKEAQAFVEKLTVDEAAQFLSDASAWHTPVEPTE